MTDKLCKTCKYWIPTALIAENYGEFGECKLARDEDNGKFLATCDSEQILGELKTVAEFGCICWERAQ